MKLKSLGIAIAIAACLTLVGCNQGNKDSQDSSTVVATVNGEAIHASTLNAFYKTVVGDRTVSQPLRAKRSLLQRIVQLKTLAQEAKKQGLDTDPTIKTRIQLQTNALLARALVKQHQQDNPVTEDDVKQAFEKKLASRDKTEYKARHILVKTQEEAKKVIKKLDNGADFAALAKKESTGPTAKKGGELGWFTASSMVPAFSQAVAKLKKGEYTHKPVKSRFGWHVILLQDTRPTPKPKLSKEKKQIKSSLTRKRAQDFIKAAQDKAHVTINDDFFKPEKSDQDTASDTVKAPAAQSPSNASTSAAAASSKAQSDASEASTDNGQ